MTVPKNSEMIRWVLPFAVYLTGTSAIAQLERAYYPFAYCGLVLIMMMLLWKQSRSLELLRPHGHVALPILVGLVGIAAWTILSKLTIDATLASYLPSWLRPSSRQAFNPIKELDQAWMQYGFIFIRAIGLVAIVPIAEELFWRGFLMRWLVSENWEQLPIGKYTLSSFSVVVAMFTLAHPEWLAAAV